MWPGVLWRLCPSPTRRPLYYKWIIWCSGYTACPGLLLCCWIKQWPKQLETRNSLFDLQMLIMVYHWEESGTWKKELKQRPWRETAYWLTLHDLFSLLSGTAQTTCSEVALLTVGWALPYQSPFKNMPRTVAQGVAPLPIVALGFSCWQKLPSWFPLTCQPSDGQYLRFLVVSFQGWG